MSHFPILSPYTFGSMSLGQQPFNLQSDVAVARRAMEAGVWFHSSPTYNQGFTYMVLRMAFDEAPSQRPRLILKIRDAEPCILRFEVEDALRRLDIEQIDIIQLVYETGRPTNVVEGFLKHDERWELVRAFKEQGKIGSAVLYLSQGHSSESSEALDAGLFDGVIFYNNLLQYDLPEGLASYLVMNPDLPVLALRTVHGGAPREPVADVAMAAKLDRLHELARASDCADVVELSMRFALGHAGVRTTIGGTKNLQHLEYFLHLASASQPLESEVVEEIEKIRGKHA